MTAVARIPASRRDEDAAEQRAGGTPTLRVDLRRKGVVALVFLAFAVAELWSPIAHGGWYLPSDIGQLFAITHVAGHSDHPKNLLPSDVYVQLAPFMHFTVQQVSAGHLPTWSDTQGNGLPFLANEQSVVFSPFTLFFYLFPFRLALIAAALARLWVLGFFTFLFLLRHRLHLISAVVGGVAFAYSGYHLVWLDYQTVVSVSASLPVALWCIRVAADADPVRGLRQRRAAWAGLAVAVGASLVGGNPETATFDLLCVVAYLVAVVVLEGRGLRRRAPLALAFAATLVVGVGLSAVQLFPFVQYQALSVREALIRANPSVVIPGFTPSTIPMIAFPNLFGAPQYAGVDSAFLAWLHPPSNYAELNGNSVGLLSICLAGVGLLELARRRRAVIGWFGLAAAVVGSLLLYSRGAGELWTHVPLVHAAFLNRSQDVALLGCSILAALGVEYLFVGRSPNVTPIRGQLVHAAKAATAFFVVGLGFLLGALALRHHVDRTAGYTPAALAFVHDQFVLEVLLAVVGLALLVGVAFLGRRAYLRAVLGSLVVVTAFLSSGLVFRSYNPTVDAWAVYQRTPAVRQLERVVGTGEALFGGGAFPSPATSRWFGVREVGAYDLDMAFHDDLYLRVFGVPAIGEAMPRCLNGLRLFGVTTVVGGSGAFSSPVAPLERAGTIGGVPYYRVPDSSHFALVGRSIEATGDRRALRLVASCRFDSSATVVLDPTSYRPDDPAPLAPAVGSTLHGATIGPTTHNGATAEAVVTTPRPAWLLIRETWAPGWRATLDGHPAVVHRADVTFQAVRVPAGRHVVRLFYDPGTLTFGGAVSAASVVVLLGMVLSAISPALPTASLRVLRYRNARRRRARRPEPR